MSRSGYSDDYDEEAFPNACDLYRTAVERAFRGERGQKLLGDLCEALDAMPVKELIAGELAQDPEGAEPGGFCALGVLGAKRGLDMRGLDPEDAPAVARAFGVAEAMAREVVYENDDCGPAAETPAERWARMRAWVAKHIVLEPKP